MQQDRKVVIWFRQDLRLHDNEAMHDALRHDERALPVYVFDERVFKGKTKHGFPKTGKFRTQFIIESIHDLRKSLRAIGSDLIVRVGKPEEEVYKIARDTRASWVFCNRERTQEEIEVQDKLEENLWTVGQELRYSRGKMLYYTQDLPFPISHTPDIFTHFRKEVERFVQVREPLPNFKNLKPIPEGIDIGEIPTLEDFGWEAVEEEERAVLPFKGGETEGLKRLRHYLWDTDCVKRYKETRNELIGANYSSKFSPWLAQGCLSPKMIYSELKKYEAERGDNKSTYWLFFELLWRDFFRLMGKKHGNAIFQKGGTKGEVNPKLRDDARLFAQWAEGRTGVPFIDANMRELNRTGFMSNRGRQNVASFLVKDLHINWLMGAEYFESQLIDYDPCSNYGNWNYIAGVGSDPRENRYFNILTQAKRYDAQGEYVKMWIPELANVPDSRIHRPDLLSFEEQGQYGVKLGGHYPKAMVKIGDWAK